MDNQNATCETVTFSCRIPTSFAKEKIGYILRLEYSTQAGLIYKAGMEYRTLYSIYAHQEAAISEAAGPQERVYGAPHFIALAPKSPLPKGCRNYKTKD